MYSLFPFSSERRRQVSLVRNYPIKTSHRTMGRAWQRMVVFLEACAVAQSVITNVFVVQPQLDPGFYDDTCPQVFPIVARNMLAAIQNESRIAGSLLRVHFHDCFVQGCDASVLLDGPPGVDEKTSRPNQGSLRGFPVLDTIKAAVAAECPNTVSCADVIALSSFFGVVLSGGPVWMIPLGRRDSLTPAFDLTTNLPPPNSDINRLKANFSGQGLSVTDLVALSGGHSIGDARCIVFTNRLYNFSTPDGSDPELNSTYKAVLKELCPIGGDGNVTTGLDKVTPRTFDNSYFKNFLTNEELLTSDNALIIGADDTRALVLEYAANQTQFFVDFAQSMINMGNLNVLTGTEGEIRTNCTVANPTTSSSRSSSGKPKTVLKQKTDPKKEGAFVDEIRTLVKRVKDEYLAEVFQRLAEEGVSNLAHSSI